MTQEGKFLDLSSKQHVNQWLCIAFLCIWCFWTLLYYFTQKAEAIGNNIVNVGQQYSDSAGDTAADSTSDSL